MSSTLLLSFLLLASTLIAQTNNNQLINSGKLLVDAEKLHDDGKYKEELQLYKQIPRSDTNYVDVLHDMAVCTFSDSDFEASRGYAELGLKLFPENASDWYNLIANALESLGKKADAALFYDKIISIDPNSYLAWFNKGILHYHLQKYADAKKCFQNALLINAFYSPAHYFLGKTYLMDGNLPAAMLCLSTSLAVNPDGKYRVNATDTLSAISHINDVVAAKADAAHFTKADNFAMQQEILTSKISLDKQYKLQTDVEDPITRQLQVLCEKLDYVKTDTGFCMQFYVPFFKDVFQQNKFNLLVNFMFGGLNIKSVQEFNKKHKKEIEDFVTFEVAYFNTIKETRMLNVQARQGVTIRYLFDDGNVSGKGAWKDNGNDKLLFGPWEFYYPGGQLKSKGTLNDKVNKEGEWFFYFKNGQLKEHSFFVDGEANGKSTYWFDNGNINEEVNYKNGKEDGEERTYYYNGLPHEIIQYKEGKKEGSAKGYKSTGDFSYDVSFKNDVQDGPEIYYYPNGKVLTQAVYVNGKVDGPYKKFAENGTVIMQGVYVSDEPDGPWKTWYPSGKIKEEYTYQNGDLTGEYNEYYENGKQMQHVNYVAGKQDGKSAYYSDDGRLTSEGNFEKGRLRAITSYDIKGNVITSNTSRNGAGFFTFYNEFGKKATESNFTKDGVKEGTSTAYFEDGVVSSTAEYRKGSLNGIKINYFHNSNLNDKLSYTDDKEDGYYTSFFSNKNPRYEGWFVDGKKQGAFIAYNAQGNRSSASWYKDDELHGYTEYYNPNGKEDYESLYDEGWLKHITQFDSTGKVLEDVSLPKGNCDFTFYYNCGKPYVKASYRNYHLQGRYDAFFPDGTQSYVKFYNQGREDSIYREYYYGGKIKTEGSYATGTKTGLWKQYYDNGQLHYDEIYADDELQGKSTFYNEDGTKNRAYFYKDNALDGSTTFYGDSNKVAIVFNYHNGRMLSYTYEGKDGKLVEPIPFDSQTGTATAYYKNGVKSAVMSYVNGVAQGMRTIYFSNGKVFFEGMRLDGDYQGVQKKYAVNGQLLSEENYDNDNLHGISKYYYPNGKIKSEENWYNGNENGTFKYYDETGKLKQTRFYYYGQLEAVQ